MNTNSVTQNKTPLKPDLLAELPKYGFHLTEDDHTVTLKYGRVTVALFTVSTTPEAILNAAGKYLREGRWL
jgi:hypothetical protein